MKKRFLLTALLVLLAVVLFGCSGGENATKAEFFQYIVNTEGNAVIIGYTGNEMSVVIPSKIDGKKVTGISFSEGSCGIMSEVVIPEGVTKIGEKAFYNCTTLTKITVPNSVTYIGDNAFKGCTNLVSITLPERVTHFEPSFTESRIAQITLPQGVTEIGQYAFYGCKNLTQIVVPDGVKVISRSAFSDCTSLRKVTLPQGLEQIHERAFAGCAKLERLELPESVTLLGEYAFWNCTSMTYLNIPAATDVIGIDFLMTSYSPDTVFRGCDKLVLHVKKGSYAEEIFHYKNLVVEE